MFRYEATSHAIRRKATTPNADQERLGEAVEPDAIGPAACEVLCPKVAFWRAGGVGGVAEILGAIGHLRRSWPSIRQIEHAMGPKTYYGSSVDTTPSSGSCTWRAPRPQLPTAWCSWACALCATTRSPPRSDGRSVTAELVTLAPFTEPEVGELLAQHTAATGQRFEPGAVAHVV